VYRSDSSNEVEGVRTFKNTLYSKKAVIVAAGCWSGSLAHDLFRESDILLNVPVKPRKVGTRIT
jgi:glycine/D-amino acid oxidase-like deaminating enzyme